MKPLIDAVAIADGFRKRLATLAAVYAKFKLNPEPPAPARESYSKFEDPVDEIFNRLARDGASAQDPRGPDHPQDDERSA